MPMIDGVTIADTIRRGVPHDRRARAIITADTREWAEIAGRTMSGYATSVIACDAEARHRADKRSILPKRPTVVLEVSVLVFAFSRDALDKSRSRIGSGKVRHDVSDNGLLQRAAGG